jgi:hypothetical protein
MFEIIYIYYWNNPMLVIIIGQSVGMILNQLFSNGYWILFKKMYVPMMVPNMIFQWISLMISLVTLW